MAPFSFIFRCEPMKGFLILDLVPLVMELGRDVNVSCTVVYFFGLSVADRLGFVLAD